VRALILGYHRIATVEIDPWALCVTPARFAQQLDVLTRSWNPISLAALKTALENRAIPDRSVVVTFDDGYADNLHVARPLLERFAVPATVFVVARSERQKAPFWWDELARLTLGRGRLPSTLRIEIEGDPLSWEIGEADGVNQLVAHPSWRAWESPPTARHAAYYAIWDRLRPLEARTREIALDTLRRQVPIAAAGTTPAILEPDEILKLGRDDLVEIGAHTMSHPILAALPLAAQRAEIGGSRRALGALLGRSVTSFAYPYGAESTYTEETVALVEEVGFTVACTTSAAAVGPDAHPLRLPRHQVEDWDGEEFARRLESWMAAAPGVGR
jgi:peptidoglycan/xylan/chitin deacetylase (PgdA/CDA1 family)